MKVEMLDEQLIKKPNFIFTSKAFAKIRALLDTEHGKKKEFGFIGSVEKSSDTYCLEDIFLPPQITQGAYWETLDETNGDWVKEEDYYGVWLNKPFPTLADRKKLRFHGHSHVEMATTPSATDTSTLKEEHIDKVKDYFIQLIINRRNDIYIAIYDKEQNFKFTEVPIYIVINDVLVNYKKVELVITDKMLKNTDFIDGTLYIDEGRIQLIPDAKPYYVLEDEYLALTTLTNELIPSKAIKEQMEKELAEAVKEKPAITNNLYPFKEDDKDDEIEPCIDAQSCHYRGTWYCRNNCDERVKKPKYPCTFDYCSQYNTDYCKKTCEYNTTRQTKYNPRGTKHGSK